MQVVRPSAARRPSAKLPGVSGFTACGTCRPNPLLDKAYGDGGAKQFAGAVSAFGKAVSVPQLARMRKDPTPPWQMNRASNLAGIVVVAIMRYPQGEWMAQLEATTNSSVRQAVQKSMRNFIGIPQADSLLIALTFVFFEAIIADQSGDKSDFISGYKNALRRFENAYSDLKRDSAKKKQLSGLGQLDYKLPTQTDLLALRKNTLTLTPAPPIMPVALPDLPFEVPKLRAEFWKVPELARYTCNGSWRVNELLQGWQGVPNALVTYPTFKKDVEGYFGAARFKELFEGTATQPSLIQRTAGSRVDPYGIGVQLFLNDAQVTAMFEYVYDSLFGTRFDARPSGSNDGHVIYIDQLTGERINSKFVKTGGHPYQSAFVERLKSDPLSSIAEELVGEARTGSYYKWGITGGRSAANDYAGWGLGDDAFEKQAKLRFQQGKLKSYPLWKDPRLVAQAYFDALNIIPIEARIATMRRELLNKNFSYEGAIDYIANNPTDLQTRGENKLIFDSDGALNYVVAYGNSWAASGLTKKRPLYPYELIQPASYGDPNASDIVYKSYVIATSTEPTERLISEYYGAAARYPTEPEMVKFIEGQSDPRKPVITDADRTPPDRPGPIESFFTWARDKISDAASFIGDLIIQAGVAASDALCKGFKFLFGENVGGFLCTITSGILKFATGMLGVGVLIIGATLRLAASVIQLLVGFFDSGGSSDYARTGKGIPPAVTNAIKNIFIIFGEIVVLLVGQVGVGLGGFPATEREYKRRVEADKAAGGDGSTVPPSLEKVSKEAAESDPFLVLKIAISVITVVTTVGVGVPMAIATLVLALSPVVTKLYAPILSKKAEFKGVELSIIENGLRSLIDLPAMVINGALTIADAIRKVVRDVTRFFIKVKLFGENELKKIWGETAKDIVVKFEEFTNTVKKGSVGDIIAGVKSISGYFPVIIIAIAAGNSESSAVSKTEAYADAQEQFIPNATTLQESNQIWAEALTRATIDLPPDQRAESFRTQFYVMRSKLETECKASPDLDACKLYAAETANEAEKIASDAPKDTPPPPVVAKKADNTVLIAAAAAGILAIVAFSGKRG
jgi:hypothetical protein